MRKKEVMNDLQPLVSVILPFYNAPYLGEAIESILNQSYSNFELILIDNGSTDQSVQIAQSYNNHTKVKLISENNRGVVFATNTGIDHSKGDFVARMDADDIAHPERLYLQANALLKDQDIGVISGLVEYLGSKENQGFIYYVDWLNSIQSPDDIHLNQFVEFPLANPTLMFRRAVLDEIGSYQEGDFPEDYELFLRLIDHGVSMRKVDHVVLTWRDTPNRLTRTDKRYSTDAFFRIKAEYLTKWLKANNPFHPQVYVWGAGRLSRRRSDYLKVNGIDIVKYIDLKESDGVIHYKSMPKPSEAFVISFVANRGARAEIKEFLNQSGYIEGTNYIIAS